MDLVHGPPRGPTPWTIPVDWVHGPPHLVDPVYGSPLINFRRHILLVNIIKDGLQTEYKRQIKYGYRVFHKEVGYAELALHPISRNVHVNTALREHLLQQIINETNLLSCSYFMWWHVFVYTINDPINAPSPKDASYLINAP